MQEEVGGASKGGVGHHRIFERGLGEDIVSAQVQVMQAQEGAGGAASCVEPDGCA